MAESPITLTDEDLLDDFQIVMSRYAKKSERPPLKIAMIGRGRQGKSTLVNNLLNLQGEEAAVSYKSGKPVTKAVGVHKNEVNGVTIYIYDTPGLQDSTIDERKVIKEIEKMTKGYVDLLFYVSSLNDRINSADERIIKAITSEFKPQVWEHAVLVLTHADNHCSDHAEYIKYTDEFAEVFQMYITKQKGCRNIRVKCIQERTEEVSDNPYEIAAIPTGLYKDAEPSGWYYNLLIEAVSKCDKETTPLLLIATSIFQGHTGKASTLIIAGKTAQYARKGAVIGTIAGAITGTVTGTVLAFPTAGLSLPAGLAIGSGIGAGLGAAAGAVAGTTAGMLAVMGSHLVPIIKRKRLLEQLRQDQ